MNREEDHLQIVKEAFVNNGEYTFNEDMKAEHFAKKLLSRIEDSYQEGNYYREYKTLIDYIYSHHADNLAHWLYAEKNL
jgi:hypothetical protein